MIELYIENEKIELRDNIDISFVLETIDPDKLSSIKNSFSKTVNIPGTSHNNHVFGHIFRNDKYIPVNIPGLPINNWFDPHKKTTFIITENGNFINRGYCTLDKINIKNTYELEYSLTLYGGIGEFFYALSYNEDGTKKTLKDLTWNWRALHQNSYSDYDEANDKDGIEEIYYCSLPNVTGSYSRLSPTNTYTGRTDIDKDIVFAPVYTGLYEEFDSRHMLVCEANVLDSYAKNFLSKEAKQIMDQTFPNVKYYKENETDPEIRFTSAGKTFHSYPTDSLTYGLVTFSRDIDPFEAGDLRINELPIAIRLSKLLYRISQPENNGGYTVEWDNEITNSNYWNYGWILIGKLKQDSKKAEYATAALSTSTYADNLHISTSNGTTTITPSGTTHHRTLTISNWTQNANQVDFDQVITITPKQTCYTDTGNKQDYASINWNRKVTQSSGPGPVIYNYTSDIIGNYYCTLTRMYDGSTFIKAYLDVFLFASDTYFNDTGNQGAVFEISAQMPKLNFFLEKVNTYFGTSITVNEITVHKNKLTYDNYSTSPNTVNFANVNDEIICKIPNNVADLGITQDIFFMWALNTYRKVNGTVVTDTYTAGIYGQDTKPVVTNIGTAGIAFFNVGQNYGSGWNIPDYYVDATLTTNVKNTLIMGNLVEGYNNISMNKTLLFAGTNTPMKYLTDFCKLLNLKFECDNTSKTIRILTIENFYNGRTYDITDRIDHSRNIEIKNILTNSKTINIGLETPETYPVSIFNKISKDKFNTKKYDTGIEYNIGEENLLDTLIYKNTIDWQQNSIFYQLYPQTPRPYATTTVSWTLWDTDSSSDNFQQSHEFITSGASVFNGRNVPTYDFFPKVALFDKDNKAVEAYPTFVFLNGFIKNYDYTNEANDVIPTITDNTAIKKDGTIVTANTIDLYEYEYNNSYYYYVTSISNSAITTEYSMIVYLDANNNVVGTQFDYPYSAQTRTMLTVPSNTKYICLNRKQTDSDFYITTSPIISPRITFSNDTPEQFILNDTRCYLSNFNYTAQAIFTGTGYYQANTDGTAASWALPYFSKDLYNVYTPDSLGWHYSGRIMNSWNIAYQNGLEEQINLNEVTFMHNPQFSYPKIVKPVYGSTGRVNPNDNEYTISSNPQCDNRIYDVIWKPWINEMYDRNTRTLTLYADLTGLGDLNQLMRNLYSFDGHLWIITKIDGYRLNNFGRDKFTKITLKKIINLDAYKINSID